MSMFITILILNTEQWILGAGAVLESEYTDEKGKQLPLA